MKESKEGASMNMGSHGSTSERQESYPDRTKKVHVVRKNTQEKCSGQHSMNFKTERGRLAYDELK